MFLGLIVGIIFCLVGTILIARYDDEHKFVGIILTIIGGVVIGWMISEDTNMKALDVLSWQDQAGDYRDFTGFGSNQEGFSCSIERQRKRVVVMEKIYGHRDKTAGKYPHDDTYTIEGYVRMKSPESGEWYDAVLYKSTTKGEVFCRERKDFEDKFKEE